ncbi:UNVERIFIED_CONTAM: hypothetical protein HDU68_007491 [Siphonaria sp. JEL0065]|nr:hypothetical protein HDU68_007491 [Siphonaria sp. JEL0065]
MGGFQQHFQTLTTPTRNSSRLSLPKVSNVHMTHALPPKPPALQLPKPQSSRSLSWVTIVRTKLNPDFKPCPKSLHLAREFQNQRSIHGRNYFNNHAASAVGGSGFAIPAVHVTDFIEYMKSRLNVSAVGVRNDGGSFHGNSMIATTPVKAAGRSKFNDQMVTPLTSPSSTSTSSSGFRTPSTAAKSFTTSLKGTVVVDLNATEGIPISSEWYKECKIWKCTKNVNINNEMEARRHLEQYHRNVRVIFKDQLYSEEITRRPDGFLHCPCGTYKSVAAKSMHAHAFKCAGLEPAKQPRVPSRLLCEPIPTLAGTKRKVSVYLPKIESDSES